MQDSSQSNNTEKPQLAAHEYLAVAIILGFFVMLTLISLFRHESLPEGLESEAHYLKPQMIDIYIQGAVESPGPYQVKINSKVQDAIDQAKPLPSADLRRYKPTSKARAGQIVTVPTRSMIVITVTGAVEAPGEVLVPRGTHVKDLEKYVQFSNGAAPAKIKHKTALKAGDSIFVPSIQG